ncbi:cytochrome c biogenesis CcdA family protein [Paenibacillus humicola]|uniref:cytochrome c biogenesis CcdA family protein n=1 Tax=Paenibacillus humicola TaxID=3110540 RepID=UPI00237B6728|nr:cytochrome c biogenesis CcdA family protein [Paenibacillus humicola]
MDNVTILVAVAAGMLSFLSPCVFPLIPAYVSHLTGSSIQDGRLVVNRRKLLVNSIGFIAGFAFIFIVLGASASFLGRFAAHERDLVQKISGLLIMAFGLQMAGFLNLRLFMSVKSWNNGIKTGRGVIRSFLTGLAFGAGWSPCVGLALSSILLLAGSSETLWSGIGLLAFYSIGLGIPFLILSWLLTYSMGIMKKMNRWMPYLSKLNGWIFIAMGLLLFTGQLQVISAWLARYTFLDITF